MYDDYYSWFFEAENKYSISHKRTRKEERDYVKIRATNELVAAAAQKEKDDAKAAEEAEIARYDALSAEDKKKEDDAKKAEA